MRSDWYKDKVKGRAVVILVGLSEVEKILTRTVFKGVHLSNTIEEAKELLISEAKKLEEKSNKENQEEN